MLTMAEDLAFAKLLLTKLPYRRFNMLYRASDHAYSAHKFHALCDGIKGTMCIVKNDCGNIFGGYTSKQWKGDCEYKKDENVFLFLIRSHDGLTQKKCPLLLEFEQEKKDHAIWCNRDHGPIFGARNEIFIQNRCDIFRSFSNMMKVGKEAISLSGAVVFRGKHSYYKVLDYEVFEVKCD